MKGSPGLILCIDQGTTSTRAIVFDPSGRRLAHAARPLNQIFAKPGWVEHSADEIWAATETVCREVLSEIAEPQRVAVIGVTNQRETTVVWDRKTGRPIYNAIVWQDRRTADACRALRSRGLEAAIARKTGLLADPYFSATKLAWLLDNVPDARARAEAGELAFGTVDSWLIWNLTAGKSHVTDITNASRTMLFNIRDRNWDHEILDWLSIPASMLPDVLPCTGEFGVTLFREFNLECPVHGVAGDQQAATVGQGCIDPGMIKATYGTGCFALLNTGDDRVSSQSRLLSTIAYDTGAERAFALEGSIFMAGATMQWLRDSLGLFEQAEETEQLARSAKPSDVVFVPAFVGLGAPYWDPDARGAILGMTRDTGINELVAAALEASCFQTCDLIEAMASDTGVRPEIIRVDGGMANNRWFLQRLSDLTGCRVERPENVETTALGASYLAAIGVGHLSGLRDVALAWRSAASFEPSVSADQRQSHFARWQDAVGRIQTRAS